MRAWATMRRGENDRAVALGQEALALAATDTPEGAAQRARILSTTVGIQATLGARPELASVSEWVELARRVGDPYEESQALAMLSVSLLFGGEDGALRAGEQSLDCARRSGSPTAISYALFVLAQAIGVSDRERALRLLDESIASAESVGNDFGAFVAGNVRGSLLSRTGDHVGAMRSWLDSAARSGRAGDRSYQAICLWGVAAELAMAGQPAKAAAVAGWARSVLGDFRGAALVEHLNASLDGLPELLGQERYAQLTAGGAAMEHDEALRYAGAEVDELLAAHD